MWEVLTGVTADQIYVHLDQEKLLSEEQKGCRKDSRGTNNLLYIDREVVKEFKSRRIYQWLGYESLYGSTSMD